MRVIECKICSPKLSSIFCGLAGAHLQILEQEKSVHRYPAGQIIFYQGELPQALHWICSGLVKLYKQGEKNEELILRLEGPGEILGYRALLAGEPYFASARAVKDTALCSISKPLILELLRQSPKLAFRLLSKRAQAIRQSEELALNLTHQSVRQRTAHLLLLLSAVNKQKSKAHPSLQVSLAHKDLAHMIGTSPESFSRALHYLSLKGFLRATRNGIYMQDFSALKNFVYKNNLA